MLYKDYLWFIHVSILELMFEWFSKEVLTHNLNKFIYECIKFNWKNYKSHMVFFQKKKERKKCNRRYKSILQQEYRNS